MNKSKLLHILDNIDRLAADEMNWGEMAVLIQQTHRLAKTVRKELEKSKDDNLHR